MPFYFIKSHNLKNFFGKISLATIDPLRNLQFLFEDIITNMK
jgi:hypothetical protein